ncbi:MAG: DUF4198 domain-containing protein [Rhodobacteraceae bacterium]|nr:DUF4198 domain-containing protein [Paracoccaceae bacterium]
MRLRSLSLVLCSLACLGQPVFGHESWVEPLKYQVESGDTVAIHMRNGEMFAGSDLAFFDHQLTRAELAGTDTTFPYEGRMGDIPAFTVQAASQGLMTLIVETEPAEVKYKTWEEFEKFLIEKDLSQIPAMHAGRGLPKQDFWETYSRHSKTLISVGHGEGSDTVRGMDIELVALSNPNGLENGAGMPVQLNAQSAPVPGTQIEVFEKAPDKTVTRFKVRTGQDGRSIVPVQPKHQYLLNAVIIRPADAGERAVWRTLWASLTFALP